MLKIAACREQHLRARIDKIKVVYNFQSQILSFIKEYALFRLE